MRRLSAGCSPYSTSACFLPPRGPAAAAAAAATCQMSEGEEVEIVASGVALSQVSKWLGVSAEDVLEEADAENEKLFDKPRPNLLGLGAKYLSHKAMEKSGLEMKLKHRLTQSVEAAGAPSYQPAQLDRHHQQQRKRKHGQDGAAQVQQQPVQQDSDDEGGKLASIQQQSSKAGQQKKQLLDRQQLLAVPVQNLSKWQRKRMRQKEKKQ